MDKKIVEENVLKGLVLDEKGKWVTIAEKLKRERSFLKHLEDGEVLSKGKWIKMDSLKSNKNQQADSLLCVSTYTELDETQNISSIKIQPLPHRQNDNLHTQSSVPPTAITTMQSKISTSEGTVTSNSFFTHPIIEAEEETKCLEKTDVKKAAARYAIAKKADEEYLEETMTFDMKAILNAANNPLNFVPQNEVLSEIEDSWIAARRKNQILIFSIAASAAFFAIAGAIVLAFLL